MNDCLARCAIVPCFEDWVQVIIDPDLPAIATRVNKQSVMHGDLCVVETPDGRFLARVTLYSPPIVRRPQGFTARLLRRASSEDERRHGDNRSVEDDIQLHVRRRIKELGLELKPLKVRVPLSGRKAVVFFSAEQRVDFRPLLRELGRKFRRRVEMRPLGVRDGARLSGGLGPCGRCLCCSTFMDKFHSVTVRMAKRQRLSLNPTKISGLCGRLMCCLAHEVDLYPEPGKKRKKKQ
jgi:cell fate regulator YaaT (PSP1 superfamily)